MPLSRPLVNLTECCAGSLSESPQEGHLACMIVVAMAAAANAVHVGLEKQEQLPAVSQLSNEEFAQLLNWVGYMFSAHAGLMRNALLGSSEVGASPTCGWASAESARSALVSMADLVQSAALHCVNRARKPQYAAALQQLRSCVPLYLAILVPSLRQLPLPGGLLCLSVTAQPLAHARS